MNINNKNNINVNFTNPKEYIEKLNLIDKQLVIAIDNFRKSFILVIMYPANQEYKQQFRNIISNLWKIFSDQFSLYNDIQVSIDKINKESLALNDFIKKEKFLEIDLNDKLWSVKQKTNASSEMISNYRDIYDIRYLRNWGLLLSTIGCIYAISVIYKKPVV
jgi:hypothetical protein